MFAQDPTRFVKIYFDAKHLDLYIYREYNTYMKRNKEIFDELYVNKKLITKEEQLIADSAEPKSIADFKAYGAFIRGAVKGPESRTYSMKWLQGLNHIYIDRRKCPYSYAEFTNYEYEQDREGNFISAYPDGNDHSIDACIRGDVEVATPHGNVAISELPIQGGIYAYDEESGQKVATQYRQCTMTRQYTEIFEVVLKDKSIIYCTYDHKILTHNRGYVMARDLTTDDIVVNINHKNGSKVKSVRLLDEHADVYDLEVPKYHNFILANGTVVHNCRYAMDRYSSRKGK